MDLKSHAYSLDHATLLQSLCNTENLLLIQDLDGVCMELVRDPLTRRLDRRYIEATHRLAGHFYVLTNGEHIGSRGVNAIVEQAFDTPEHVREQGFYLPGLAAGGVQLQDRHGRVSHPGVTDEELAFLHSVPQRARQFLRDLLAVAPYSLSADAIAAMIESCVLDNPASPTLNINRLHQHFQDRPHSWISLQQAASVFMGELLQHAAASGLGDSFFIHYAPNLGRDDNGDERVKYSEGDNAGTTDFQFMLKGAIKEVGVLVILNHYYHQRCGRYPLGEHFNARQSPRELDALLQLAQDHFDPALMPRIVGVGDTVTSYPQNDHDGTHYQRGGSDRGFLTLVQQLGRRFDTDNVVVYIDSSGGEVRRPGVDRDHLQRHAERPDLSVWNALRGTTDADDPLTLDVIFPEGHRQYVDFFCRLADQR
ncbi:glucosylglycerol 3-phosphatase [Sinimarinibacterium sp. CAU 1509]|uniref:glucosylglycerol 3-phosphatase n=1 Tax=Sinimarinibacterium sp. CAU 1509 TaxID=2562283 RepID=UPI001B7F8EA5|nr:glucosylglycerol 3-phosphatase [Sinimarinibacterium sp. CAU 1509]